MRISVVCRLKNFPQALAHILIPETKFAPAACVLLDSPAC